MACRGAPSSATWSSWGKAPSLSTTHSRPKGEAEVVVEVENQAELQLELERLPPSSLS